MSPRRANALVAVSLVMLLGVVSLTAPSTTAWIDRADSLTTTGSDTSLGIFDAVRTSTGATGNLTVTASIASGHVVIAGAFKIAPSGPTAYTLPAEASGRKAVKLTPGQYVEFTLPSAANAITVRYSIPDAPTGGG